MICRGQYSIRLEINNIAKGERNWGKLIQNKAWREQVRKQLLESSEQWCDYKTNRCACEENYVSYVSRFDRGIA